MDKYIPRGFQGNNPQNNDKTSIWDNGKDWSKPCTSEGGWVRIYPLISIKPKYTIDYVSLSETTRKIEKEIRNTVISIQKYLKAAKEVHKKNEKYRDEQYNAMLRKMLELNTEIWLPSK